MDKKQQCHFCASNMKSVDYKDTETLKNFLNPQSKILPKRKTFVCSTHQRKLSRAIKRARQMALVPFVTH